MNTTKSVYKGRFAPSPTGALHFGSLIAAVSSYLQAKSQQGQWLIRIEDVDKTREIPGSAEHILSTLDSLGFEWDDTVIYQSQQTELYEYYLHTLISKGLVYACDCSRSKLKQSATKAGIYPGYCRGTKRSLTSPYALRCQVSSDTVNINDQIQGALCVNLADNCGDFVIKRRDQFFAYQLAVVADDHSQGITDIIRGADLLPSTPIQIYLQQQLEFSTPHYGHIPVAMHAHGQKLSKSHQDLSLHEHDAVETLHQALLFLDQSPPEDLAHSSQSEFWQWAIQNWDIKRISRQREKVFALDLSLGGTL